MILELWDKIHSNERNWFVSYIIENSIDNEMSSQSLNTSKDMKQSTKENKDKSKQHENEKDTKESKELKEKKSKL